MYGGTKRTRCSVCEKDISANNIQKHVLSCKGVVQKKIRGVDFDPNIGFRTGERKQWNTGLTKSTDARVNKYGESLKGNSKIGRCTDPELELLRRQKLSKAARKQGFGGYRANAGHSKKYKVLDSYGTSVTLQSSYELACSIILNDLGIRWVRPKALIYDTRKYYPDFYLVDYNIYLDPKNSYKAKQDAEKISTASAQNNAVIIVLLEEHLTKEFIASVIQ